MTDVRRGRGLGQSPGELAACDDAPTRRKPRTCSAPDVAPFRCKAAADARRKCQGPGRPRMMALERDQVELEELLRCWGCAP